MDFFEEFQTWSCHRLYGRGNHWSRFIHKSWKESMHTTYGSVFPEPDPHGSIITRSSMTCSEMREAGGSGSLCPTEMIFLDSAIWWRERNTALQYLKSSSAHGGNYVKLGSSVAPQSKWITEILIPASPLCPFLLLGMLHVWWPSFYYFFLCSTF